MKTWLLVAELFHADGRTDVMILIFAFRKHCEQAKKKTKSAKKYALCKINSRYTVIIQEIL
jgi:hypothetical protein